MDPFAIRMLYDLVLFIGNWWQCLFPDTAGLHRKWSEWGKWRRDGKWLWLISYFDVLQPCTEIWFLFQCNPICVLFTADSWFWGFWHSSFQRRWNSCWNDWDRGKNNVSLRLIQGIYIRVPVWFSMHSFINYSIWLLLQCSTRKYVIYLWLLRQFLFSSPSPFFFKISLLNSSLTQSVLEYRNLVSL